MEAAEDIEISMASLERRTKTHRTALIRIRLYLGNEGWWIDVYGGVDIGGTNLRIGLVSNETRLSCFEMVPQAEILG